jgi:hypothetical protein
MVKCHEKSLKIPKGVIRSRKSKGRQFNGQTKTGQKDKQRSKKKTLPKTKDRESPIPI